MAQPTAPGQQDTWWARAKQHLAPAAGDVAARRLGSEMPARGDGAAKQKADETKHRETMARARRCRVTCGESHPASCS